MKCNLIELEASLGQIMTDEFLCLEILFYSPYSCQ